MKSSQLKKIIKEEIENALLEQKVFNRLKKFFGFGSKPKKGPDIPLPPPKPKPNPTQGKQQRARKGNSFAGLAQRLDKKFTLPSEAIFKKLGLKKTWGSPQDGPFNTARYELPVLPDGQTYKQPIKIERLYIEDTLHPNPGSKESKIATDHYRAEIVIAGSSFSAPTKTSMKVWNNKAVMQRFDPNARIDLPDKKNDTVGIYRFE